MYRSPELGGSTYHRLPLNKLGDKDAEEDFIGSKARSAGDQKPVQSPSPCIPDVKEKKCRRHRFA